MRVLLDENTSGSVIQALRARGHDVVSVKESMRGQPDSAVLDRARREGRLLVTHDKDFGELAFRSRLPAPCGILLFRLSGSDPDSDSRRIVSVIESRDDWAGHFAAVTDARIRVRELPPAASR
jgi:predicted nuclease of predicted toxin-antitoxin system